jgi:hypothetical protein
MVDLGSDMLRLLARMTFGARKASLSPCAIRTMIFRRDAVDLATECSFEVLGRFPCQTS